MIQVLGLRDYQSRGKTKKRETFFEKGWRFENVQDVFNPEKLQQVLDNVPDAERYNLYFTVADCYEESGRKLKEQWAIPFDIDGLQLEDPETKQPYIPTACYQIAERAARAAATALGVPYEEMPVVFTGNGVQLFVLLSKPIVDEKFFDKAREAYALVANKIQNSLNNEKIVGEVDRSVWSAGRLMRLPHTLNKKKNRPERASYILNQTAVPRDYDIFIEAGVTLQEVPETLTQNFIKNYPKPDTVAVCTGCKFLVWCKSNPEKVREPQWYAMTSITARLDDGEELTHSFSEGHPQYQHYETELKIKQSLEAAGPRTCKDIGTRWDGCTDCEYYGKVTSPIMIRGEDYIASKDFGFRERKQVETENGGTKIVPGKPVFNDLIKHFNVEHTYKVVKDNDQVIIYNGKYWEFISEREVKQWMTKLVKPDPSASEMSEFYERLKCHRVTSLDELFNQKDGHMNFQNCVLNMKTGETFTHSPDFGFFDVRPYAYDPRAVAPTWDKFLVDIMSGRTHMADTLKEFAGYCISGDTYWFHRALLLVGDGDNGKSVFMEVLGEVVGKDSHSAIPLQDLAKPTMRHHLVNKLFNYSEETKPTALNESEIFKVLASGGQITIKQLYMQEYTVQNKAKLIISANKMPYSQDKSHGLLKRLLIVKFNEIFKEGDPRRDEFLKEKLMRELPGICNGLIAAYKNLRTNKRLSGAAELAQETLNYQQESDTVVMFCEDVIIQCEEEDGQIKTSELYQEYVIMCEGKNLKPANAITFGKSFSKYTGIKAATTSRNGVSYKVYRGIKINKEY